MSEPCLKRRKIKETKLQKSPRTIVTWNCNGFASRAQYDSEKIQLLLTSTQYPDMICIQEARLKAFDKNQRDKPMMSEYLLIRDTMNGVLKDYKAIWSLADSRYAGTLTLIHKRINIDATATVTAFNTESAIDLLLQRYKIKNRKDVAGISEKEEMNQENEQNPKNGAKKERQTSVTSFFAPKKKMNPSTTVKKSSNIKNLQKRHTVEGRFQFFSFEDIDIIQTYVPNNGTKEESFARRKNWDRQLLTFFQDRRQILEHVKQTERPMLWCGDMNVAKDYRDGTHWSKSKEDGTIYEWWTDEKKCIVKSSSKAVNKKQQPAFKKMPEDTGMPGFTPAERKRFQEMFKAGDFIDAWRELHPEGVTTDSGGHDYKKEWDRPNWTWRGHPAKPGSGRFTAKYEGRGQRLDYFLLSPASKLALLKNIESCEILGYGSMREGMFCASDHCASILKLKQEFE